MEGGGAGKERERRHIRSSASDDKFWQLRQRGRVGTSRAQLGFVVARLEGAMGREENFLILSARNRLPLLALAEPRAEEGREHWEPPRPLHHYGTLLSPRLYPGTKVGLSIPSSLGRFSFEPFESSPVIPHQNRPAEVSVPSSATSRSAGFGNISCWPGVSAGVCIRQSQVR